GIRQLHHFVVRLRVSTSSYFWLGCLCVYLTLLFFFFFFSSRRRHTRSVSAFLLNRSSDLRDYFMQRYHDVISSFGGKTSYDADNRPLLVMRSNLWASGYDVDGTDQTSLGQFSGRVQQTYKHSVPRFFVPEHGTMFTLAL